MLAHLLHRDRGVVPLNDFDCTNTLKMIERVWHRVRGVVPPYDTDPNEDAFSYNIALGGDPPRDVMVGAALGTDVPWAEGGCLCGQMRFLYPSWLKLRESSLDKRLPQS